MERTTRRSIAITQSNLTIRGEGRKGRSSRGAVYGQLRFEVAKGVNNVTIDHLGVTGFGSSAITVAGKNVSIQGCYIHNNLKGIDVLSGPNDIVHIYENEIFDSDVGILSERSSKLIIERNNIHDNNTAILANGGTIRNNVIFDNRLEGIEASGKTYIYHNTIDGEGVEGDIGISIQKSKTTPTIMYNIVTGFDVGIQRVNGSGAAKLDYNNLWNNITNYGGADQGPHDISEDPLYNDPDNSDFHLRPGSPCIDIIPISSAHPVTDDYNNNSRPQGAGYDIGAYEVVVKGSLSAGCSYVVSPTSSISYRVSAGTGTVDVTADSGCAWTAVSNDPSWITVTSGSSGTGPGTVTVSYSVAANDTCSYRQGTMTIAGQDLYISQDGHATISPTSSTSYPASGGTGTVDVRADSGCAWTAVSNDSWITITSGSSGTGPGTMTVSYSVAANGTCNYRQGTMTIAGQDLYISQDGHATISPTSPTSYPVSGGTGTVDVTAYSGCAWTAVSNDSWITITSGSSGTGPGTVTVSYSVAANDTCNYRQGTMTIAGQDLYISQDGTTTIYPLTSNFSVSGGMGSVVVTAGSGCAWTAASFTYWLTITSGSSGTGSGSVNYSVSPNDTCIDRTAYMRIAGQDFFAYQAGTATLSATTANFSASGGTGSVVVTAGSGCAWTAVSNDYWITITSGSSGTGSGPVNYSVAPNACNYRQGTMTIAGQDFYVYQAGTATLSATSANFSASGGTGSVVVTAGSGCAWTAVSNDYWITITSGSSGTGSGPVNYSVAANTCLNRSGSMTIAGQYFYVYQAGTATISRQVPIFQPREGRGAVAVTADSTCAWTAASNDVWITVTSGSSGSGNGTVNYSVASNTGAQRTGTMTIAAQTFIVNQSSSCTFVIDATNTSYPLSGGTGSINVTAEGGCAWTAASNVGWITITSGASGTGNGTVNYSVAANDTCFYRSGFIAIADQGVSIYQEGSVVMSATSSNSYTTSGGTGNVAVTAGGGCTWTAASNAGWITITSGASGTGNGTVNYSVAANDTCIYRSGSDNCSWSGSFDLPGRKRCRLRDEFQLLYNLGRNGECSGDRRGQLYMDRRE